MNTSSFALSSTKHNKNRMIAKYDSNIDLNMQKYLKYTITFLYYKFH